MSGTYGGIPSLICASQRRSPLSSGRDRHRRHGIGWSNGGVRTSSNYVADRSRALSNGYVQVSAQVLTDQGNTAWSPIFQVPSSNYPNVVQRHQMIQEHATSHSSSSYDMGVGPGFASQQQAEAFYGGEMSLGMDWTSGQTNSTIPMAGISSTTELSEPYQDQSVDQDLFEVLYSEQSRPLMPLHFFSLATPGPSFPQMMHDSYENLSQLQPPYGLAESQISTEPWSVVNPRARELQRASLDPERMQAFTRMNVDSLTSADEYSEGVESSMPINNPAMSEATFNSDIEDITNSCSTLRDLDIKGQPRPQSIHQRTHPETHVFSNTAQFVYRVESEGTLLQVRGDGPSTQVNTAGHRGSLPIPVPGSPYSETSSASTSPSQMSVASSSVPTTLQCDEDRCEATFTGDYRKGNLARHKRRIHNGAPGDYLCEDTHCGRTFNRSDSRLKHYRVHHPSLARGPAEPRKHRDQDRLNRF